MEVEKGNARSSYFSGVFQAATDSFRAVSCCFPFLLFLPCCTHLSQLRWRELAMFVIEHSLPKLKFVPTEYLPAE